MHRLKVKDAITLGGAVNRSLWRWTEIAHSCKGLFSAITNNSVLMESIYRLRQKVLLEFTFITLLTKGSR